MPFSSPEDLPGPGIEFVSLALADRFFTTEPQGKSNYNVRLTKTNLDWFQIGKGVCQGCILSSCLLNLHAQYIMGNAGLDEAQAGIRVVYDSAILPSFNFDFFFHRFVVLYFFCCP